MKKTLLLAAILLAFSCTKESIVNPGTSEGAVFTAHIDTENVDLSDNKTQLDGDDENGYKVIWIANDQINVNGTTLKLDPSFAGKETGKFTSIETVEPDTDGKFKAYFPFGIVTSNYKLSSTIYPLEGNIKNFPMYAESDNTELSFKNLCGILRISITNSGDKDFSIDRIDVTAAQPMSGYFTPVRDESGFHPEITGGEGGLTMTKINTVLSPGAKVSYMFPAPENDYTFFTIAIYDTEGNNKIVYSKKAISVKKNGITPIDFNVTPDFKDTKSIYYKAKSNQIFNKYTEGKQFPTSTTGDKNPTYVNVTNHKYDATTQEGIITFDNNPTGIGFNAFTNCTDLLEIKLGPTIKQVGVSAFEGCTSLTSIKIPSISGVTASTTFSNYAFKNCTSLTNITLPSRITTLPAGTFQGCTALESIVLPEGLTTLNTSVFDGCTKLKSIVIPSSLKTIAGNYCFRDCKSLESITLPEGFTGGTNANLGTLMANTFYNCSSLKSIVIPDGITSIDNNAFYGCSALESIDIPDSVTSLGTSVFYCCSSLKSLSFPDGITKLLTNMIQGCSSLESIEFPAELTEIPEKLFMPNQTTGDFSKLSSVIFRGDKLTTIGTYAFYKCSGIVSLELPSSVRTIGSHAFDQCTSLQSIDLPSGIEVISEATFNACNNLSSVKIPSTVTSIEKQAFNNTKLTVVNIPSSVLSLGPKSFYISSVNYSVHLGRYCPEDENPLTKIDDIEQEETNPAFYLTKLQKIYVPSEDALSEYSNAPSWSRYKDKFDVDN